MLFTLQFSIQSLVDAFNDIQNNVIDVSMVSQNIENDGQAFQYNPSELTQICQKTNDYYSFTVKKLEQAHHNYLISNYTASSNNTIFPFLNVAKKCNITFPIHTQNKNAECTFSSIFDDFTYQNPIIPDEGIVVLKNQTTYVWPGSSYFDGIQIQRYAFKKKFRMFIDASKGNNVTLLTASLFILSIHPTSKVEIFTFQKQVNNIYNGIAGNFNITNLLNLQLRGDSQFDCVYQAQSSTFINIAFSNGYFIQKMQHFNGIIFNTDLGFNFKYKNNQSNLELDQYLMTMDENNYFNQQLVSNIRNQAAYCLKYFDLQLNNLTTLQATIQIRQTIIKLLEPYASEGTIQTYSIYSSNNLDNKAVHYLVKPMFINGIYQGVIASSIQLLEIYSHFIPQNFEFYTGQLFISNDEYIGLISKDKHSFDPEYQADFNQNFKILYPNIILSNITIQFNELSRYVANSYYRQIPLLHSSSVIINNQTLSSVVKRMMQFQQSQYTIPISNIQSTWYNTENKYTQIKQIDVSVNKLLISQSLRDDLLFIFLLPQIIGSDDNKLQIDFTTDSQIFWDSQNNCTFFKQYFNVNQCIGDIDNLLKLRIPWQYLQLFINLDNGSLSSVSHQQFKQVKLSFQKMTMIDLFRDLVLTKTSQVQLKVSNYTIVFNNRLLYYLHYNRLVLFLALQNFNNSKVLTFQNSQPCVYTSFLEIQLCFNAIGTIDIFDGFVTSLGYSRSYYYQIVSSNDNLGLKSCPLEFNYNNIYFNVQESFFTYTKQRNYQKVSLQDTIQDESFQFIIPLSQSSLARIQILGTLQQLNQQYYQQNLSKFVINNYGFIVLYPDFSKNDFVQYNINNYFHYDGQYCSNSKYSMLLIKALYDNGYLDIYPQFNSGQQCMQFQIQGISTQTSFEFGNKVIYIQKVIGSNFYELKTDLSIIVGLQFDEFPCFTSFEDLNLFYQKLNQNKSSQIMGQHQLQYPFRQTKEIQQIIDVDTFIYTPRKANPFKDPFFVVLTIIISVLVFSQTIQLFQ